MNKYQILDVQGSHIDVGLAIGESFRTEIQEVIAERKVEIPNYDSYLEKSKAYFNFTKEVFPHLISETEAIAKAAGVSVVDYFFLNNRETYDPAESYDKKEAVNPDHCTIVVGFGKDGLIVGHNEDWSIDAQDSLYILKATIGDITFTGLNYKTVIAGVSASVNNYGLVQCINDLYQTNQFGVPKNYLARAVLECKTLDDAESLIRNTKRASGFNHVLAQGNEVRNLEIAGDRLSVEKIIEKPYVHTNHYTSPEMKSLEKFHTKSSEARYARAKELLKDTMELENIKNLLSDTSNLEFPICREDATIGSVIVIPAREMFLASYGHPCSNDYAEY